MNAVETRDCGCARDARPEHEKRRVNLVRIIGRLRGALGSLSHQEIMAWLCTLENEIEASFEALFPSPPSPGGECRADDVVFVVGANTRGGWSLYPVTQRAKDLCSVRGATAAVGNFDTKDRACATAAMNLWAVAND